MKPSWKRFHKVYNVRIFYANFCMLVALSEITGVTRAITAIVAFNYDIIFVDGKKNCWNMVVRILKLNNNHSKQDYQKIWIFFLLRVKKKNITKIGGNFSKDVYRKHPLKRLTWAVKPHHRQTKSSPTYLTAQQFRLFDIVSEY